MANKNILADTYLGYTMTVANIKQVEESCM